VWTSVTGALEGIWDDVSGILVDPEQRAFWPFLLSSLAIGGVALWWRSRSGRVALGDLLTPRVWLHRSARMDYRLVILKAVIQVLLLAPLALSALAIAVAVVDGLTSIAGPATASDLSPLQITAIYTAVLFVAWDLSRFVVHLLLHRVPALWEFHKVHHSAEVLTPFTVYRVHPVESLLFGMRGAAVTGVVTGVFFYLFQNKAVQVELLGVNAIGVVLNAAGANLRHSHVWLSYGRVIEKFLISPAQHQLHHSVDPQDYDCNYGSFLSIWDRLFGTLRLARRRPSRFGLAEAERNHDPHGAVSAVLGPFSALARRAAVLARLHPVRKKQHETNPL
jgi:sterol desaturase/sphingolipid hydroxylase (fatty acid hydroxylase superfamily)